MNYKIIVFSDSHGDRNALSEIIKYEMPVHFIIHCGDGVGDLLSLDIPDGTVVVKVTGNIDLSRGYDIERIEFLELNGYKIMVTHGDLFRVQDGLGMLLSEGKRACVDLILFGHTHKKYLSDGNPRLFNPGPANKGSYGVITLGEKMMFSHRALPEQSAVIEI